MLTVDRHGLPSALAERLTDEVRASFAETPREGRFKFLAQALNLDEAALLAELSRLTGLEVLEEPAIDPEGMKILPEDSRDYARQVEALPPEMVMSAEDLVEAALRGLEAVAYERAVEGREMVILRLVADGLSSKEIAKELDVSPRTIEVHRARVMEKLGARNTADLLRIVLLQDDQSSPKPSFTRPTSFMSAASAPSPSTRMVMLSPRAAPSIINPMIELPVTQLSSLLTCTCTASGNRETAVTNLALARACNPRALVITTVCSVIARFPAPAGQRRR